VQVFWAMRHRAATRLVVGAMMAVVSGHIASAQPAVASGAAIFGMGTQSCSTAVQSRYAAESVGWALGYFSAFNIVNARNHAVGRSIGAKGILEQVKQECETHSSEAFDLAISKIYDLLEKTGQ
jgi:hypothetical protein